MNQEWTQDNEKIIEHFRELLLDTSSSLDLFQKIFSKVKGIEYVDENIKVKLVTHNYIMKYLIFCMESVFCDKINGTQFYRNQ